MYTRNIDGKDWKPDLKIYNGIVNFKINDVLVVNQKKIFFLKKK